MSFMRSVAFIFLISITAIGCVGEGTYAPISDSRFTGKQVPKTHLVVRGDTLFSIAWAYGIDFEGLADTNRINSPFIIYPGQRLLLKRGVKKPSTSVKKPANKPSKSALVRAKLAAKNSSSNAKKVTSSSSLASKPGIQKRWQWPLKGKLLTKYDAASVIHKGIDIQGKMGESVYAISGGKVVYAGNGLVGYGNVLIIKHDEQYLSAYGHNRRLLVAEGELVKDGQKIAEVGDTGSDRVKLHFEIRSHGKPVNPLKYLK